MASNAPAQPASSTSKWLRAPALLFVIAAGACGLAVAAAALYATAIGETALALAGLGVLLVAAASIVLVEALAR